ncbi:hypothetical protein AXF42_Ash010639 [Apostasia shenzhenica]|uniref:GBF-interacting protein 1 N-terminal domain-containing protein n=1 Tax=Apostasia shenzhenica TaxID=1088818 RepID=A0A2I0A6N2_9ASPA|nr:hypothetical protein AXF42_Ash010639 [Apostasia shenzhenica]
MVISLSGGKGQEPSCCSSPASDSMVSNNLAKLLKLEDLHISDAQHLIIPDHLQVPESEKTGLTFGSFGSNFELIMSSRTEPENEVVLEELSESSSELEENADNLPSNSSPDIENSNYYANEQSEMPENHSTAVSCSPDLSQAADYGQLKAEVSLPPGGFQPTISSTTPVYSNLGMVPQMLGSHFSTFEGEGLHAHDNAHLRSVAVPQTFDPSANYYASIYRLADGDDRVFPFPSIAPKYSGNIADFPAQIALSPQKSDNSLLLSSTGVAPLVTQTAGVRETSVAASQQQIHVHRQPAGIPLSHYPPNCVSYAQYFSPFYVPSSAMHHFSGNTAIFPQQPPTRSLYPPPAAVGVNPVKYPISQYKPASNSNPTGQGTYVLNHSGYGSIMRGNSTVSGDLMSSQFKEKQGSSFYNIPPQGQPIAFAPTPTQAGHSGAFAGLYHPSRSVAAASVHPLLQQSQAMARASEVLGPPVGIYQQTQHTPQINWVSNF